MTTSKEVFALRKEGLLDEAYSKSLELIADNPNDDWNKKAFAWCLYDQIKRSVSQNDYVSAITYCEKFESLSLNENDDILNKALENAKILVNPEKKIILLAKEKSIQGEHEEALNLYRQAYLKFPDDINLNTQFAWELQKEGKVLFESEKVDSLKIRKILSEYIKLKNERPSQLHSLFLRYADKIKDNEDFNFINFLKLWDLKNLREEDFNQNIYQGKSYPSLAEKIIQHSLKIIINKNLLTEVNYFLPYLEGGIIRFPENIWLTYYKAKLLHLLNRNEDAIQFLIPVVKEKFNDYWSWSLLAEIILETNKEIAFSCYCNSLLCNGDDKFIVNVRSKFAELIIEKEHWNEAKYEISTVIKIKEAEGIKISERLLELQQSEWYKNAKKLVSNSELYTKYQNLAEDFILESLPWLDTCIGESFVIPDKPDIPKRKLFVKYDNKVIEVITPDRKLNHKNNLISGDACSIKGEFNNSKFFHVYSTKDRNSSEKWDIFEWKEGNIVNSYINEKNNTKIWRISFIDNGVMKEGILNEQNISFSSKLIDGLPVFVKFYQSESQKDTYSFKDERKVRADILTIKERPNGILWDSFTDRIGIIDHINKEKGIAHFIVSKEIGGIFKLDLLNAVIEIGNFVKVKVKKIKKDSETYYIALTCNLTNDKSSEDLLRPFSGSVEISNYIGFADNVFIDSSFIDSNNLEEGDEISGTAILNYNKKKNKWGWKAIKIDTVEKTEDTEF